MSPTRASAASPASARTGHSSAPSGAGSSRAGKTSPGRSSGSTSTRPGGSYRSNGTRRRGGGHITSGTNQVTELTIYYGAFHVGDAIEATGVPARDDRHRGRQRHASALGQCDLERRPVHPGARDDRRHLGNRRRVGGRSRARGSAVRHRRRRGRSRRRARGRAVRTLPTWSSGPRRPSTPRK